MLDQDAIDALRHQLIPEQRNLIDGRKVAATSGETRATISPIDGGILANLAESAADDVARAVASARAAYTDGRWSGRAPIERKQVMLEWANLIEKNALELAVLGTRENGTEIRMAFNAEPMNAANTIRYYAEALDKIYGEIAPTALDVLGLIHREPVGVVGAIVPWNFPLMIGTWKLAPALAVGNSVVLKPSESASLTLLRIGELALEAGLPPGVLNIVTGGGAVAGEALAMSMDVDVLTFTGSGPVGRRLLEYSARSNLKRIYLELGGKSANVIFPDADLNAAAGGTIGAIFPNSGQVCVAASRLLVQRDVFDEVLEKVIAGAQSLVVGDPLSLLNSTGAVHGAAQLQKNLNAVQAAVAAGAEVVTGGHALHGESGGTYMAPTILKGASAQSDLFRDEIFGPVLSVHSFDTEEEALHLANGTDYGLAGAIWTNDLSRAHRMIRGMHTGMVQVNRAAPVDVTSPLGGVKQSGNGYDKSLHAVDKFTNLKTAWLKI